jgi:hypothetical protein
MRLDDHWTIGTMSAMIVAVLGLMWTGSHPEAPAPERPPSSGIALRTEVPTIWICGALRDLARQQTGTSMHRPPEEIQTCLARNGWGAAWYALTYRGHQVRGGFAVLSQIRRVSEAAEHLDELQSVLAKAAGRPPKNESVDYSPGVVVIIPDALQDVDPPEAITRMMAGQVAEEKGSLEACQRSSPGC